MKITLSSNFRIVENPQQNRDVFDLNSTSINDKSGQGENPTLAAHAKTEKQTQPKMVKSVTSRTSQQSAVE